MFTDTLLKTSTRFTLVPSKELWGRMALWVTYMSIELAQNFTNYLPAFHIRQRTAYRTYKTQDTNPYWKVVNLMLADIRNGALEVSADGSEIYNLAVSE